MHVYFYAPTTNRIDLRAAYRVMKKVLQESDAYVSSNTEAEEIHVSPAVRQAAATGSMLLEHMDAIIIEGTLPDPQVGFLLAQAMAMKKPTLFLYRRGTVPFIFTHLSHGELPPFVQVVAYQDVTLADRFRSVLKTLVGKKLREVPRIKFTLRITPTIEQYLEFKTHNTDISKADFLRDRIQSEMEDDADWTKSQRRQSPPE